MITRVMLCREEAVAEAARLIRSGLPVAVPTETVYGLAADATSQAAVAAIYAAKNRPPINPLIVHVPSLAAARAIGTFSATALALAEAHWPGPLTIVVPRRSDAEIAPMATAGLPTVALRVPDHDGMQALLAASGLPLAAPSANASGTISPTRAEHVLHTLQGRIPLIIDGGPTTGGIESTIIKVDGDQVYLLRHGPIVIDAALPNPAAHVEAPGQLAGHYAPAKPLRLDAHDASPDEWLIGFGDITGNDTLSASGNLAEAAARLFDLLHAADQSFARRIAVAPIPHTGIGHALNDRLARAAAGVR